MIVGTTTVGLEATIRFAIRDSCGKEHDIQAIIDTGFTGSLTLSPAVIASLGLPWRNRGSAVLANGTVDQFDIYAATIVWDGMPRQILVEAVDTDALAGMRLIVGHELIIQAVAGGRVSIRALP